MRLKIGVLLAVSVAAVLIQRPGVPRCRCVSRRLFIDIKQIVPFDQFLNLRELLLRNRTVIFPQLQKDAARSDRKKTAKQKSRRKRRHQPAASPMIRHRFIPRFWKIRDDRFILFRQVNPSLCA